MLQLPMQALENALTQRHSVGRVHIAVDLTSGVQASELVPPCSRDAEVQAAGCRTRMLTLPVR